MLELRDRAVIAAAAGNRHPRSWIALLAMIALLLGQPAWSQATCTWILVGSGQWDEPANWGGCTGGNGDPANTPGPADHAIIGDSDEVDVGSIARTVNRLTVTNGHIFGDADMTVISGLTWNGGVIDGGLSPTQLLLSSGSVSTISGAFHNLAKRDLVNAGEITWDAGDIELTEDAEIDNQGQFIIDYSGGVRGGTDPLELRGDFSPSARIHNASTLGAFIEKRGDQTAVFAASIAFDNGNDVLVNDGTLQINGPGGDFGAYQVASIARLEFGNESGVDRDLTGSTAVSGSGVLHKFGSGTLNISGGYALTGPTEVVDGLLFLDTAVNPESLPVLRVGATGIFDSSNQVVVTGVLAWNGGEIRGTEGSTLTLGPGASATVALDDAHPEVLLRMRTLINQGTVLVTGTGSSPGNHRFTLDGADIDNQGDFELRSDNLNNLVLDCASQNCARFFNRPGATLRFNDIQGIAVVGPSLTTLNNEGLVELVSGCGQINAPGVDTGTYRYDSSCTLAFFTRPDTERVFESTVVLDPINSSALQLGGSLRVNGTARSFGNLIIDNTATLFGPAAITLAGTTELRGQIEGLSSETVTVAPAAVLQTNAEPSDTPLLFGRRIINDGVIDVRVRLLLDGDAEIVNNSQINLQGTPAFAGSIGCASPPLCGRITNNSTGIVYTLAAPAGPAAQLETDVTVDNQGQLIVDNGVLALESPFSAAAGSTIEVRDGAGLRRTVGNLVLAGGVLSGAGVINADVDVDAVDIHPAGTAPGNLAILGDFTATASTRFQMGIAGIVPPAASKLGERAPVGVPTYDRLTIAGTASLNGTLDVVDLGYTASGSDVFDLMLYAARNGNVVGGANPYSGVGLNLQTEATRIRLAGAGGGGCVWNPGGAGANDWTNPAKWINCTGGVGPGPGPAGTPGAADTAIIGGGSSVNLDVPVTIAGLQFTGGTIGGANNLTVTTELIWTGGRFQGTSANLVTIGSSASASLSGGQHTVDGRTFVLATTANWTTGLIELANGGVFEITPSGVLNSNPSIAFESIFGSGSGTAEVRNGGTIAKLGPNFSGIGQSVQYSGIGAIQVSAGDFTFAASSLSALNGSYTAAPGSTLQFVGSDRSFGPSSTLDGGNLVFGDSGPMPGINVVQSCIGSGSTVFIRTAELVLNCAGPSNLAGLQMQSPLGVLEGSSAIRVTGNFGWGHGTIRGTGLGQTFEIAAGANAQFDAPQGNQVPRVLSNRRFRNDGSISWIAANATEVNDGGQLTNESGGQLFLAGIGTRNVITNAPATSLIINNGALTVDDGVLADLDVLFDNAGSVQLIDGDLRVRRNGNDLGSYTVGAGNVLYFDGATRSMGPGSAVSGAGGVRVMGSASVTTNGTFEPHDLRIESGGLVQIDSASPQTVQTLYLENGTLTGNAEVRIGTHFSWRNGGVITSVGASPGPLVVESTAMAQLCGGLCTLSNRVLRIEGQANWTGGVVEVPMGAAAKIIVATGGTLQTTTFKSAARYRCAAPTCTAEMEVEGSLLQLGDGAVFDLSSPLLVNGGTLSVVDSFMQVPGVTMSAGVIDVRDPGELSATSVVLNGGVLRGTGLINGSVDNVSGSVQPGASPGQITILGSYFQGASATLDIQVGGLNPGTDSDYVVATAGCSIAGTLNVANAGFPLTAPDTLDFLSCAYGLSGTFGATNIAYPGYEVVYGALMATLAPGGGPLVVNTVGDAGDGICDLSECTLRDALITANLLPDPDVIEFNIPGPQCLGATGACAITPTSPLPAISGSLVIDGYSQPGASPNANPPSAGLGSNSVLKVEIDGQLVTVAPGLVINASGANVVVAGLSIHGFATGIVTQGPGDGTYQIVGNYLGFRADGSKLNGQGVGVSVQGGNTRIGDGTAFGMNVISGNSQQGVSIQSIPSLASLLVQGNLIGTTANGLAAQLSNGMQGIGASTSSAIAGIVIGGNLPDQRNVISGNGEDGIRLHCTATVGNCFDGARITGNFIGPAADGSPLGNQGNGVHLSAMDGGRVYIGGISAGEGNRIAFNGGNGVLATFGGVGRASFERNEIYLNGQLGIDLGGDARTANDVGDADTGANGLLNFPTFTSYSAPGGNSAVIDVTLDTPDIGGNYPARVDFYKAVEDEPGLWLGSTTCSAPGINCPASFAFPSGVTVAPDDIVLGIVTDGFGKSSEASFYAATATIVSDSPDPSPIGTPYTVTVEVSSTSPFAPVGDVFIDDGSRRGGNCAAPLAASGPSVSSGSCVLNSFAPAGPRALSASYGPTSLGLPFTDSSDGEAHVVAVGAPPLVNSTADPGDGTCDLAECTLREAIALANATLAPTVDFDSAFFAVPRTITLTAGELVPTQDVSINGPTGAALTISGNDTSRILYATGIDLALSHLTLTGGNSTGTASPGVGGAILHTAGDLTLTDVVVAGNRCTAAGTGGAIALTFGSFNLTRVSVTGNTCETVGGIYVQDGNLTTVDSSLTGNSGTDGEALRVAASGGVTNATLTNVTVSGNSTTNSNSAIRSEPQSGSTVSLTLTNVTVSGNTTTAAGANGAVWQRPFGGTHITVLHNTIVAGNLVGGVANDIEGSLDPVSSHNVIGAGGGLSNGVNGNQIGIFDPLLAPLSNYGGNTLTRALLPGSPAINAGSNGLATNADQRGITRPLLGNVDVGAFESQGFAMAPVSGSPQTAALNTAFASPLVVGIVANAAGEPVDGGRVVYSAPVSGASATLSVPAPIAGGQASVTATANAILGTYGVTATAAGASGTTSFLLTNGLRATTTAITGVVPTASVVGQPYAVSVSVLDGSTPVTVGTVEVRQLSDGATCSFSLAAANSCTLVGNSAITTAVRATYLGAGGFGPSQSAALAHVVARADTAVQIVSDTPDPSVVGATITISVQLGVVAPGAGVPTGEILITDGIASCGIVLPNLSCQMTPKAVGEATLEARYPGDANFSASTDTEAHTFTADGADLAIIKRNGLRLIPGGVPSTYVLLVTNAGPQDVVNARVTDILPAQFSAASWTCSASNGASCPATGAGTVDALVSLASGTSVTFALTATAQVSPEQIVSNRATVTPPPNAPDPVPENNESVDVDAIGVFGEGFETESE